MNSIGSRLAEARKNCNLTQAQAAEKLYVTTQAVSSWENGNTIPDADRFPEIAELYGVTIDFLLAGSIPPPEVAEVTRDLSDRLFNEARMATYIGAYCNAKHLYQTKRALAFAKEKHYGQDSKTGFSGERIPFIYHPLLVTCHALALGLEDDDLLSACLLHDVLEDCDVVPEELPVNEKTREAVMLLTKPESFQDTPEEETAYYDAIAENRIAAIVKLLDRCNNVSRMATSFTDSHIARYIKETQDYVLPLMEKARDRYPEYSNALFLIRYHMNSVVEALRHHMRYSMSSAAQEKKN